MKKSIFLLLIWAIAFNCHASGDAVIAPKTSTLAKSLFQPAKEVTLPPLNLTEAERLDKNDSKTGDLPKFSRSIYTNISLDNSGSWAVLPDGGRVWRVKISSEGALALIPFYNRFYLPEGATLHIYSPDKQEIYGAFTHTDNPETGYYCTGLLHGEECVIEYYEPATQIGKGQLSINEVGYAYRWIKSYKEESRGFGDADNCQVNVNCTEGNNWQDEKRAVVRILVQTNFGQGFCSGALVNNVRQDCTPYLLSAQHCSEGTSVSQYAQYVFYFNYEAPGCNDPASQGTLATKTVVGCTKKADSNDNGGATGSDFLLLQLNSQPLSTYNAYYAGWNAVNTPSSSGVTIHHPDADIKKISTYTIATVSDEWGSVNNTHWRVRWAATTNGHGVTEEGSSGGPLFNAQGQIIGQLTGGESFCTATNDPDKYGKFSYNWTSNGAAANRQLKAWLDPDNTGTTSLGGANAPCGTLFQTDAGIESIESPVNNLCTGAFEPTVVLKNYGISTLTTVTIAYQINGTSYQYNWTGSLVTSASTTVVLSTVNLPEGTHSISFQTLDPNSSTDGNTANDSKSKNFNVVPQSGVLNLYLKTDVYGSETTWQITNASQNVVATGGPYNDNFNGQTHNIPVCLPAGCFKFTLYDSYGDGMNSNINGQMKLTAFSGTITYAELTNPAFGDSVSYNFCIQGTGLNTLSGVTIGIMPNPSTGVFTVNVPTQGQKNIRIFDALGKMIMTESSNEEKLLLNLAPYGSGVYFLYAETANGVAVKKLVVQ